MRAFEADQVVARSLEHGELYLEIVRGSTASVGLYTLAVGAHDPQGVHDEDEVYHVLEGRARLRVAGDDRPVGPGSIVYIDAGVPHSFHSIEEPLRVLVFFSEVTAAAAGGAAGAARAPEHEMAAGQAVAAGDRQAAVVQFGRSPR